MTEPEPDIRAEGEHVYLATLTASDGSRSEHRVEVPTDLLDAWGLDISGEPPLVRAAVELLQARHDRLPDEFVITAPQVAYDGFLDQLELTLGD